MFKYGNGSLKYLDDKRLHPDIKYFMEDVLKESVVDISIIDGARTLYDQQVLFDKNVTELDGTNEQSDHQIEKYADHLGRAVDAIPAVKGVDIWDYKNLETVNAWSELFRAILRVDRLWKQKNIDVGLELGWTYNIGNIYDYPHISFKKI